jgi:hypothetical protein
MKSYYTVRTNNGITFHIQASSHNEAQLRAASPLIPMQIALMVQQALNNVVSVEPHRGPQHPLRYPVFEDEFFNNL